MVFPTYVAGVPQCHRVLSRRIVLNGEQLPHAGDDSDELGFTGRDGGEAAAELSPQAKVVLSATLQCGSHEHSLTTSFSGGQAT